MNPRRLDFDSEDGAVAIVVGLLMVIFVMFLALVLDLGAVRADVRANQSYADFAATAGVETLNDGGTHVEACEEAFKYFEANAEAASGGTIDCAPFAALDAACDASTAAIAVEGTSGSYTLRITMPVPDDDPLMTRHGLVTDETVDGRDPCDRIGVEIFRERQHLFASVGGFDSATSWADAVALTSQKGDGEEFASLVVLDRYECGALTVSGQSKVLVDTFTAADGTVYDGFIAIDSDASGSNCTTALATGDRKAIDAQNNASCGDTVWCGIRATGEIFVHGINAGNAATSYDECDLDDGTGQSCNGKPVLVDPRPIGGNRVTRAPIDHRYNCRSTYDLTEADSAQYPWDQTPIEGCSSGDDEHITALVNAYQGVNNVNASAAGFAIYPDDVVGASCSVAPSDVVVVPGTLNPNWYVDCGNLEIRGELTFEDVDVVVVKGQSNKGITLRSDGRLEVNPVAGISGSLGKDAVLYLQSGGVDRAGQSGFELHRTLFYMHQGYMSTAGGVGTGAFTLVAPEGPADPDCSYTTVPVAACFEDLAMWSNGLADHNFSGEGSMYIEGAIFTPNAGRSGTYFSLTGQGNNILDHAQFIAHRIALGGQGFIRMRPDPERMTGFPLTGGGLIR